MNIQTFLDEISDEKGSLAIVATDLIDRMDEESFLELMEEIKLKHELITAMLNNEATWEMVDRVYEFLNQTKTK